VIQENKLSKLLSLVLRHQPETIGIQLDHAGWVAVDELLRQLDAHGKAATRELLERTVHNNDKQRFAFNDDKTRIRASQGHSVDVDLALAAVAPPDILFHGTASRFLASIEREGLKPGDRHHVHLSASVDVAISVGKRHGQPVVLIVDAAAMHAAGHDFFQSANGVWLTAAVPTQYLRKDGV
jgi:putative RNA 2'-phosphotransferase